MWYILAFCYIELKPLKGSKSLNKKSKKRDISVIFLSAIEHVILSSRALVQMLKIKKDFLSAIEQEAAY